MIIAARLVLLLILSFAGYCIYRGVTGTPRWLWTAALVLYLVSAPFAMSIGVILVAPAFMSAGAAMASHLRRGDRRVMAVGAVAALLVWLLWWRFGDITWVFYPPLGLLEAAFS